MMRSDDRETVRGFVAACMNMVWEYGICMSFSKIDARKIHAAQHTSDKIIVRQQHKFKKYHVTYQRIFCTLFRPSFKRLMYCIKKI